MPNNYSMTPEAYAQFEFENRQFPVACELCGIVDINTEKNLLETGWLLAHETECCPSCLKRMTGYEGEILESRESEIETGIRGEQSDTMRTMREWKLPFVRSQEKAQIHNDRG